MLGLRKQKGQALVEFSLVLPILTIMTIGSILLGIYFTQRSTMTGITFIAAREAALDPNPQAAANRAHKKLARGGPEWMQDSQVRASNDGRLVSVTLNHSGNMNLPLLANAGQAAAPGSRPLDHFADIQETVLMSSEVVNRTGGNHPHHPHTGNIVDYRHKTSLQLGGVQLTPDLQRLPGLDRLLKQVAPQTDDMTPQERAQAASGCAENAAGNCANANIHGEHGFLKQMRDDYDPYTGRVTGTPQQNLLVLLRDSRIAAKIAKKTGFVAAAKLADPSGTMATVMQGLKSVAQTVEGVFSGLAKGTKTTNDLAFSKQPIPLAQYQQSK